MNYLITDKYGFKELSRRVNELNVENLVECICDDNFSKKLKNVALIIDDNTNDLIRIVKFLEENKLIENVIGINNINSFYKIVPELKTSPIFISIDFDLGSGEIYADTSQVYLKIKELYPNVPAIGYTNFENSGSPDENPETKALIKLFNEREDSVFDKTNINRASAFNNIVRDKIRIVNSLAEKEKMSKEILILKNYKQKTENDLDDSLPKTSGKTYIVGSTSIKMRMAYRDLMLMKETNFRVVLCGETGTGKEPFAQALHEDSGRKGQFLKKDCGTYLGADVNWVKTDLFGKIKNNNDPEVKGILEIANKGTVFLDEFHRLNVEIQGLLMRFLETGEFSPLGSTKIVKSDVRLIFGTNEDIKTKIRKGEYGTDFLARIMEYTINIPPLRDRIGDIPELVNYFISDDKLLKNFSRPADYKNRFSVTPEALLRLQNLNFNENVRQLRNTISASMNLSVKDNMQREGKYQITENHVIEAYNKGIGGQYDDVRNIIHADNTNVQYVLDEILRIVTTYSVKTSISEEFIASKFVTNSSKRQIGVARQTFRKDYWEPNKDEIIKLMKKNLEEYLIIINRCLFIKNEFDKHLTSKKKYEK